MKKKNAFRELKTVITKLSKGSIKKYNKCTKFGNKNKFAPV